MKIVHLVASELKRLTASSMARLALVALMLVPVLYAGLYLWANNDPYGNLKDVPVALVVEDTGATLDGKAVNYGDEVRDQLLKDASVGWHVTSAADAEQGVRDGKFDFILTLGPDFSSALTSASGNAPEQAVVKLTTNDTNSFLATTIAGQVAEKVRASITERVGKEAALTLLNGFATVRTNLGEAVDGATKLADGSTTAAHGALTLAQGSGSANIGALQLNDGLQQLQAGSADLPAQAAALNDGAQQVAAGNAELSTKATQVASAVQDAVNQVPQARADIVALLDQTDLTPEQKAAILAQLDQVGTKIDDGNAQVQDANAKIGELAAGSAAVAAGTQQLADSAPTLSNGIASAASGASELSAGITQIAQGSLDLSNGLNELNGGADTLRDGLESGLADVPDQTADQREAAAQTISDPVSLDTSAVTKASNYGAGMAPFFISLAAWIGIYALFLIVKPLSRRALTALKKPLAVTTAGWLTPAILGALQMTAVFGIITLALGYQVEHGWGMFGFMVLTSATFATIILALNILLGSVGQFLGLVLMVLQLVTAGGTFPWQTLPGPLQVLHNILPMSHAVDGIRQLMYGGNLDLAAADATALLCWLLGALLISFLGARRMTRHRTLRDLRPSLIG
ncbi:YhgE/Pip domain-containing protein [Herbiconiux ginsengi]|uniref:Putative membrane protein n=1 Tax=Herbiconiux ginsengi TaxID=381665 RepID=A0A1H3MLX7_9MICO|nr:YhgE/Pip domain-containing protein [Herbiconiux ginsengi]SDY77145.1 putative membrane protein [Herbiconiux ginsengi]